MFTNHQNNPSIKPTKPHEQKQLFQNYQPFVKKNKATTTLTTPLTIVINHQFHTSNTNQQSHSPLFLI